MDYLNRTLLRPATVNALPADPATMAGDTAAILGNVLKTGEISDAERAYLVSAVVNSTAATPAEAATRVDAAILAAQTARSDAEKGLADAKATADQLAADAKAAAIKAAEAARISAILSAFLLASAAMVAAAAAYIGAVRGGRHRDAGRIFGGFAYRG
jgi:inorganic triphosphatase YgiF